jgi:hypothetical protein
MQDEVDEDMSTSPLPPELFEAITLGSVEPLERLKARLRGDERVSVSDTVPLFDQMMTRTKRATPAEYAEIEAARKRVIAHNGVRPLAELISVIEDGLLDAFDQKLKEQSPAAWAMSKILKNGRVTAEDLRGKYHKTYNLPAEVVPAIETRRVQLLSFARARMRDGNLFSNEEVDQITQFCVDYTNTRFSQDIIRDRFPSGQVPMPILPGNIGSPTAEICEEVIKLVESVVSDMDYNERQHEGVLVPDGQGRARSVLRTIPT